MCNPSFIRSLNVCSFSIYRVWNTWDLLLYLRKTRSLTSVPCHQHPPIMSVATSSPPPPFVVSLWATSQLLLQSPLHCCSPGGISSHCYTQCGVEARALQTDPSWEPVQLRTDCVKLPHPPELHKGFLLPGRHPTEQAGHPTWKHFPPSKYAPPPNVLFPCWQANSFPVYLFPHSRIRQQLFFRCTQHIRNELKPRGLASALANTITRLHCCLLWSHRPRIKVHVTT